MMNKCPTHRRLLRTFDFKCRTQTLLVIPMIDHTDHRDEGSREPRNILRPDPIFDYINAKCVSNWFPTKSYLFPQRARVVAAAAPNTRPRSNEVLLISFENEQDAVLMKLGLTTSQTSLLTEWWREFEDEKYFPHPIYTECETSVSGLIKINGEHIDVDVYSSIEIPGRKLTASWRIGDKIYRWVSHLMEDTWAQKSD